MSIKDLFNKPGTPKIQKSVTSDELVQNVESSEYVEAKKKEFERFVPPIDFSDPSSFAKFGSAELYYEKAFERIHNYYPYDGTLHEKIEFENSSSYLDKYVFDNLYPRTNGYLTFNGNNQFISVFGGPHTASNGMIGKTFDSTFDDSMKYDEAKKRTSAFEFRGADGITAEFWLKPTTIATNYNIFHISSSAGDGEIRLEQESQNLILTVISGAVSPISSVFTGIVPDTNWNYFAVTLLSSSAGMTTKAYRNGKFFDQTTVTRDIPHILTTTSGLNMRVGRRHDNARPLNGSMDEFRFWKTARTSEQIYNNWFIPVGGGTNKHDSNISLSCYFKFNEGITGTTSLDQVALDYSGRINNGTIVNYVASMRNTGSAIREKLSESEFLDPIIYSSHPDVVAKKAEYKASGSLSDNENTSMLFGYFPGWMQETDEQQGKQLKYLSQVMGSYFDTLWHQINFVNKIQDDYYISGSNQSLPFAKKLLYDRGFVMPDLFVDATVTENLLGKDDNEVYEKEINEVRNTIYHNIYSNLNTIYKSKGTEKAFRNFFRSLGIGEDLVKLRMYADDSTFVLRNNYELKSFERKFLNFNHSGHFDGTLYQTSSATNSNIHLPGDTSFTGSYTLETEIFLPRKQRSNEAGYLTFANLTASVMGFHTSGSTYTHPASDQDLSVYVIKENTDAQLSPDDSHRVRFMVTGGFGELTSSVVNYQYENNKWNLAVKVKHENYPYANLTGNVSNNYLIEFYGVEADGYTKRNSFYVTSSITSNYFSSNKIFYAGAHRTNFTGSSLHNTDIKLGFVRYWHSFLSNDAIDQHAYDPETFGANRPFENDLVNTYSKEIPREKTLAFHWAFNDLTTSDGSGELLVSDLSSGSANSDYGSLSNTIQRYVQGRAVGFNASSQNALDKLYLQTARKRLPDDLMSSDLTTIKTDETEQFFVDDDVSDNFYAFEKSLWGTISDEMMSMFSTALDLNNLIGQPNQKYHHRYNIADFMRDRFFDDVENEPDIEKFTSFYKWIDDAISVAIQQLIPASARFSEKINNVIESHALERNKYVHQVPVLTTFESTEGSAKGISEMKYNWQFGHAPTNPDNEGNHTLWQRERKEKSGLRETLRTSRNNHSIQSSGLIRREIAGTARVSDTYAVRKFAKINDFEIVSRDTIHGGTNFGRKKNLQLFHESIAPAGTTGTSSIPQNVITVGVGPGQGVVSEVVNNDAPPTKKKHQLNALIGNRASNEYGYNILGDFILPMNVMSGTVKSGFNKIVQLRFRSGSHIANLHNDVVGNYNEVSIQGPFTEQHVGGLQYRHIDPNPGTDTPNNRPEGWGLVMKDHPATNPDTDGALGFVGADYEAPYPSATALKATRYRDEHAKRPVNIRNIKDISGSFKAGNYTNGIQLFSVSPTYQKTWAKRIQDDATVDILPPFIASEFGANSTTHYQSLMGIAPFSTGNTFGVANNNRQPDTGSVVIDTITTNTFSNATFTVQANNGNSTSGETLFLTQSTNNTSISLSSITYNAFVDSDNYNSLKSSLESFLTSETVSFSQTDSKYFYGLNVSQSNANNSSVVTASYAAGFGTSNGGMFGFGFAGHWAHTFSNEAHYVLDVTGRMAVFFSGSYLVCEQYYTDASGDGFKDQSFINVSGAGQQNKYFFVETVRDSGQTLNVSEVVRFYSGSNGVNSSVGRVPHSDVTENLAIRTSGTGTPGGTLTYSNAGNTIRLFKNLGKSGEVWIDEAVLYNSNIGGTARNNIIANMPTPTVQTSNLVSHLHFGSGSATSGSITGVAIPDDTIFINNAAGASTDFRLDSLANFQVSHLYNPRDRDGYLAVSGSASFTIATANSTSDLRITMTETGSFFSSLSNSTISSTTSTNIFSFSNDNVIQVPSKNAQYVSERNIVSRFSAPGGPEVQSIGYLDAHTQTFSVHNALPFRNLSVLGSGSGEAGTIRVEDHLGRRRGLKTLRALHQGKFGIDSKFGVISATVYPTNGSFNKQHRNTQTRYESGSALIITGSAHDNMFINSSIPRSEFQYSWINSAISGSNWRNGQRILGYAPRDGIVSSSAGYVEAIVFPTASTIYPV